MKYKLTLVLLLLILFISTMIYGRLLEWGASKGLPHVLFFLFVLASYTFRIDRMLVNDAPFLWVGGFTAFVMIILLADMAFFSGLIFELHENVIRAVFVFICSGIMAKCLWALNAGDEDSP